VVERRIKARKLECPYIFRRGGRKLGEFRKVWKKACEEAKLPNKLVYDLRRTAVRNMSRAGVSRHIAMRISGHRTEAVFERYNIGGDDDIREAMAKTAAYVEALPTKLNLVPFNSGEKAAV